MGSLAGLLWLDLLRRAGVNIRLRTFVALGALTAIPTIALSLAIVAIAF